MRGKAIYISSQKGNSGCPYTTSHNSPIISYLGLLPGIFIENNSVTEKNVVYMTGALIERCAFSPSIVLKRDNEKDTESIEFPYQFSGLDSIKKIFNTEKTFQESFKKYLFNEEELEKKFSDGIKKFIKLDVSKLPNEVLYPRIVICSAVI